MRRAMQYALAAGLLCSTGCELINGATVVESTFSADMPRLAISFDGNIIWVDHAVAEILGGPPLGEERELTAIDASTGAIVFQRQPFSAAFEIRDLVTAYESGQGDAVWVLHDNGFRTRWNASGTFTGAEFPIPSAQFPADSREFCAMARGLDGASYYTTGDKNGAYTKYYLYRHQGGVWSRTQITANDCPDTDFDVALEEVAVKAPYYAQEYEVTWHDPDTLVEQHAIDVPTHDGDFVAFNHNIAVAVGWLWNGDIRLYDDEGVLTHLEDTVRPKGLDLHYGNNMVQLWYSGDGPGETTVGTFVLD
ncbi:MAG: hypothetical protein AAF721_10905 [Myxococcota bacterium]